MPIVSFENVSKRYRLGLTQASLPRFVSNLVRRSVRATVGGQKDSDAVWALRDVSFTLDRGESLALVGPNGAGKTTILRLLANITSPTTGRASVTGRLSALIELGAGFHPDLTGRDNAFLNGAILGLSRKEIASKFDEIVAFSGLERFIDTPLKRYSPGMVTRLGFSVAACIEPELLLVDEVLAVGDASFGQKCLQRIEELIRQGTAVIFVSHNLYLVKAVCERGLYLQQGCVRQAGTAADVIRAYEQDLHLGLATARAGPRGLLEGGAPVEILSMTICDESGTPAEGTPLSSDRPAVIRVAYRARTDVDGANVAVVVRRTDGLACCMARSSAEGSRFRLERGEGVVSVTLRPLQLTGGAYFAEASFWSENDAIEISAQRKHSDWFSVAGKTLSLDEQAGIFEPRMSWSQETEAVRVPAAGAVKVGR